MRRLAVLLALLMPVLLACGGETPPVGSTPADPTAATGDDGPWGTAVGGLVLGLDVPKDVYAGDEPLVFGVRAKNVGDTLLRLHLFNDEMWHYHVTFESLSGGPDFWGGSGLFLDYDKPPDQTLAPGALWERSADLRDERRRYLRIIENRQPGDDWDYRDRLPAGRYRAWLEYAPQVGGGEVYWKGAARTNTVEIEVGE